MRSPSATIRSSASDRPRGSCSRSSLSARRMRREGMRAATSALAVRRITRSWNENSSLRRAPRPGRRGGGGDKKPSRANPRTCATVSPNSLATSRVVYPFMPGRLASRTSHFPLGDRSRGGLPPGLRLHPLRGLPLSGCALPLEARLQRFHEIDDLRLRRLGRLLRDLLPLDLALNLLEDPLAHVVLVVLGTERLGRGLLHE